MRRCLLALLVAGSCALGGSAVATAQPQLPDNNAARGYCADLDRRAADLDARADRADDAGRAHSLRARAEDLRQQASNTGCSVFD